MRFEYSLSPLAIIIVVVVFAGKCWQASDLPGRDIREQFADRTLQDDICYNVCDDSSEFFFGQVQVQEVKVENEGFFGSIVNRFDDVFDTGSKFGRLMNGIFTLFRLKHPGNKPRYEISTDAILPVLTNYSMKAKSLAAMIRNESATYAAASDTPDVVKTLFDISAENMESVSSVIDPMLDEMRQKETMDLVTISCYIERLLTHIQDETLPNIVSITEFIYTKSGNADMEKMYDNYVSASTVPPDGLAKAIISRIEDSTLNQCRAQGSLLTLFPTDMVMESSSTSVQSRLDNVDGCIVLIPILIVGLIIVYPLSFLVSLVTIIFVIFRIILAVIFKKPILPEDDEETDDCVNPLECEPPPIVIPDWFNRLFGPLGLIALPILIPITIIVSIFIFFSVLLSRPLTTMSNNVTNDDVMQKVLMVLESSMENMVDSFKSMYRNEDTGDTESTMDCEIKTISCKNDALMTALPF